MQTTNRLVAIIIVLSLALGAPAPTNAQGLPSNLATTQPQTSGPFGSCTGRLGETWFWTDGVTYECRLVQGSAIWVNQATGSVSVATPPLYDPYTQATSQATESAPPTITTPNSTQPPIPSQAQTTFLDSSEPHITITGNKMEVTLNGQSIEVTPVPGGKGKIYVPELTSGTIHTFPVTRTTWRLVYKYKGGLDWPWEWESSTVTEQKSWVEMGLQPMMYISDEGATKVYGLFEFLTFGMVGTVNAGTLEGINGYQLIRQGSGAGTSWIARASGPTVVIGALIYLSDIWVITQPVQAIAAPLAAAASISATVTDHGLAYQLEIDPDCKGRFNESITNLSFTTQLPSPCLDEVAKFNFLSQVDDYLREHGWRDRNRIPFMQKCAEALRTSP